jgi:predicted Zn-dependent protease
MPVRHLLTALLPYLLCLPLLAIPRVLAQGLPELGEPAQAALTPLQERVLGQSIMKEARRDPDFYDDAEVTDYVVRVGNRLAADQRVCTARRTHRRAHRVDRRFAK